MVFLMKTVFLLIALLTIPATAQVVRTEITKATTPELDAKGLNPDVPDVYAVSGRIERVVIMRFKYQADLLAGIEEMVKLDTALVRSVSVVASTPLDEPCR